jgi:hypothetical protein
MTHFHSSNIRGIITSIGGYPAMYCELVPASLALTCNLNQAPKSTLLMVILMIRYRGLSKRYL